MSKFNLGCHLPECQLRVIIIPFSYFVTLLLPLPYCPCPFYSLSGEAALPPVLRSGACLSKRGVVGTMWAPQPPTLSHNNSQHHFESSLQSTRLCGVFGQIALFFQSVFTLQVNTITTVVVIFQRCYSVQYTTISVCISCHRVWQRSWCNKCSGLCNKFWSASKQMSPKLGKSLEKNPARVLRRKNPTFWRSCSPEKPHRAGEAQAYRYLAYTTEWQTACMAVSHKSWARKSLRA